MMAGRFEAEGIAQAVEHLRPRGFPDSDGPVALNVGMATYGAGAGAGLANSTLQQEQVDDLTDIFHAIFMLRQPHRPADDDLFAKAQHLHCLLDLQAMDATGLRQLLKIVACELIDKSFVAFRLPGDKVPIEDRFGMLLFLVPKQQHDRFEEGDIAVDLHLQEQVGKRRTSGDQLTGALWVDESHQARFRQGVDGDDLAAVLLAALQGREHPRMVGAGVLAHDDDHFGLVEVGQRYRSFADAQGFGEPGTARLMAHIGAVGQVVGSEFPDEKLVKESRLIGVRPEV